MSENYTMVSVPKKTSNAGRPKGKKSYVMLFRWEDVKTCTRDEKGVKVTAFEMAEGKKPIAVYATDSTINIYHTSEGEDDARGFIHHVDYEHPGTELEHDEFVNNNINENLGAIVFGCSGDDAKIAGTPCTPLKMTKADSQDNKEGDKNTINLASSLRGGTIGHIAKSLIPATDSEEITFIEHQRVSDNAQVDTLAKLRIAVASPEVTGYFIWSNDDIYVMNPVALPHIALPKVSGKLVPMRFKGLYAENMKQTAMLLEKNGLPCLNYETHTPVLFDKERLTAMFERFPELEKGGYLFTSVYYNSHPYPTQPVYLDWKTDQVLLPVVSQSPDENKVVDILSRKVFMNNTVSGYSSWLEKFLDKCFPVSSDFEN